MKRHTCIRGVAAILLVLTMIVGLGACGGSSSSSNGSSNGSSGGISGSAS